MLIHLMVHPFLVVIVLFLWTLIVLLLLVVAFGRIGSSHIGQIISMRDSRYRVLLLRTYCLLFTVISFWWEIKMYIEYTFGGRHPHPGNGKPSEPNGQGASSPGIPCSPLSPRSPFRPRFPGGPASPLPPFSPRGPSWPGIPSVPFYKTKIYIINYIEIYYDWFYWLTYRESWIASLTFRTCFTLCTL